MPERSPDLSSCLNDFALDLIMLDPENLVSLGDLLNNLEDLKKIYAAIDSAESDQVLTGLGKILEGLILGKIIDKTLAVELMGHGIKLLQELERNHYQKQDFKEDIGGFLSDLKDKLHLELDPCGQPPESAGQRQREADPAVVEEAQTPGENHSSIALNQDKEIYYDFFAEAAEYIAESEINIIDLEQGPDNKEIINSLFRSFHTIKGVSGFLNLTLIHNLTHEVENLLNEARKDRLPVTPPIVDLILDSIDLVKKMIFDLKTSLEGGQDWRADYELDAFLDRIKAAQQGDVPDVKESYQDYAGWKLGEILIDQGQITASELEQALEDMEEGRLRKLGEFLLEQGFISSDDLENALAEQ
ncbi:MAG: Hpt domain-containing protein, partial [Deltaproteobacteria bacterium]|nr:Hpt domain-containing protein [Deltaproteobacteria bacterium]